MGIIASLAKQQTESPFSGMGQGRRIWDRIFEHAPTNKEERAVQRPVPGGTYGRSMVSADAAMIRLLQAMRSRAPGGWSDDRYEEAKHYVGITYVAIHRQNELLSQGEFQVFIKDDRSPDGKKPVPKGHPGYKLIELLEKPNRDDSFGDMLAQWNLQLDLTGMALTWMVPNKLGVPMELYPIPTCIAIPQPAINPDYPDGYWRIQPVYPYGPFSSYPTPTTAVGAPIPAQWMLRWKYPHPILRYDGYSPQTGLRLTLDEVESMDRSRWYSMKRSMNFSGVLNMDGMEGSQALPPEEIDRIRAEVEAILQGPENAGQLYVAAPGAKLEPWGNKPTDMDYQSGWDQLTSFNLGAFGITKPAAGMVEDSSYSNLFATLKQLYWLTLDPKCNRVSSALTRQLAPFFGDDLIVEVRCKRLDDEELKLQKLDKAVSGKCITKNELRKELDLPLTREEWGADIAGDPSQNEMAQQQQDQQQQMQMMQQDQQGKEKLQQQQQESGKEQLAEKLKADVEKSRAKPGGISAGSLGPRMKRLSTYDELMGTFRNGNGKR